MICKKCKQNKDMCTEFYKSETCKTGFRATCKKCHNKKSIENQKNNLERLKKITDWQKTNRDRKNASARKYSASVKGRARKMYHAIVWRTTHISSYKNILCNVEISEFLNWAIPEIELFLKENSGKTPSVDRMNPDGNYEIGNIRIIDLGENIIRSRYLEKHLGLSVESSYFEKIEGLQKIVNAFCENLNLPKMKLIEE